jgi:hypothetical protein
MVEKISLELRGGLGNQLFGVATALYFKQALDITIRISTLNIDKSHSARGSNVQRMAFPKGTFLTRREKQIIRVKSKINYWNQPPFIVKEEMEANFEERNKKLIESIKRHRESGEILIKGFFQDFAYADSIPNLHRYTDLGNPAIKLPKNFIAVHIRLSDYQNHINTLGVLAMKYYNDAIKLALERIDLPILIFSDDIEAARNMIDIRPPVDITFMNSKSMKDPLNTFWALTRANVMILSNSTFSYWAAYLNNNAQFIFYPNQFRRDGGEAIKNIPKHWTPLPSLWQE